MQLDFFLSFFCKASKHTHHRESFSGQGPVLGPVGARFWRQPSPGGAASRLLGGQRPTQVLVGLVPHAAQTGNTGPRACSPSPRALPGGCALWRACSGVGSGVTVARGTVAARPHEAGPPDGGERQTLSRSRR